MESEHTPVRHTTAVRVDADPPETDAAPAAVRLATRAAIVAAAADVVLMAVIGEVIPPLAVFVILTAVLIGGLRRRPAALVTWLGVLALVANVAGAPFWTQDVFYPAETIAFLWAVLSAGGRFVVIAGAVMVRREADDRRAGLVSAVAIGVLGIAVVATVVGRATLTTDELAAGDVRATIEDAEFPDAISVERGGVVYVDNIDPYRHTFTVEGTDVDVDVPGGVARRVAVDLGPGTYVVVCEVPGHESMQSTLEVS